MKTALTFGIPRLLRVGVTRLITIGAVYLTFAAAPSANAAVTVADYTFSGGSLASSTNAFAIATDITAGPGVAGKTGFHTIFGSTVYDGVTSDNLPLTEADAVSDGDYISLTITPKTGSLNYDTLFFELCVGANNISNPFDGDVAVRSSVDNFTSDLLTASNDDNTAGQSSETGAGSFPGGAANLTFASQSGTVEFRFYFFDNENGSSLSNVGVTGIVFTATQVPEPETWADILLSLGGLLLVLRCRRSWVRTTTRDH